MTTSNIKSVKLTTDELVKTAEEARARRKLLAASKKGNETRRTSIDEKEQLVKEGTHVVLMRLNDERDSLDAADEKVEEELSQLDPNYFTPTTSQPAPEPTAEATTTPVVADEPAPPAQPTKPVQTAQTVVLESQPATTTVVTDEKTKKSHKRYDPRGWTWMEFILGLLGAFIGLAVVLKTVYPITAIFTIGDGLNVPSHVLHWIIGIAWSLGFIVGGFGLGLWIGNLIWKRAHPRYLKWRDRKVTTTKSTTSTTVPPVA